MPFWRRMRNCSGLRMARHSSSDFWTLETAPSAEAMATQRRCVRRARAVGAARRERCEAAWRAGLKAAREKPACESESMAAMARFSTSARNRGVDFVRPRSGIPNPLCASVARCSPPRRLSPPLSQLPHF